MKSQTTLKHFFKIEPEEWLLFLTFVCITIVDAITLETAYVLSVSGFVSNIGIERMPLMWLVDMFIILFMSGLYSLVVDRIPRLKLVQGLVLLMLGINILFRILFEYGAPDWLTFSGLFLWAEQQYVIFPLAFWALANDSYSVAQSKRLFPLIAAAGLIGRIIGSGYAGASAKIFAQNGIHPSALLLTNAVLLLIAFGILIWASKFLTIHKTRQEAGKFKVKEMLSTGFDFIRNVPAFKYLAVAMLCVGGVLVVIEFHFLFTSDQTFLNDPTGFQTFYGYYRMGLTLVTLIIQMTLTSRLLSWIGLKSMFMALPITLVAGLSWMLAVPGIIGGAVGRFLARLIFDSLDRPSRQTLQGLIPEERRGRISTFMGSYLYVVGNIFGSTMLILTILATSLQWVTESSAIYFYLILGFLIAGVAVYATWRMWLVYDESMLDWRLARRRRRGTTNVMSKLDF